MKGISTAAVFLIAAIIFVALLIIFGWTQGWLPLFGGITGSSCREDFTRACGGEITWNEIADKDIGCPIYFGGTQKTVLDRCLPDRKGEAIDEDACDEFCALFLGG